MTHRNTARLLEGTSLVKSCCSCKPLRLLLSIDNLTFLNTCFALVGLLLAYCVFGSCLLRSIACSRRRPASPASSCQLLGPKALSRRRRPLRRCCHSASAAMNSLSRRRRRPLRRCCSSARPHAPPDRPSYRRQSACAAGLTKGRVRHKYLTHALNRSSPTSMQPARTDDSSESDQSFRHIQKISAQHARTWRM